MARPTQAGQKIPGAVIAKLTPQVLKSLVDNYKIEVDGMEPSSGGGAGGMAHLTARLDQQGDQIKGLLAAVKHLTEQVSALGGKPAKKTAKAIKATT